MNKSYIFLPIDTLNNGINFRYVFSVPPSNTKHKNKHNRQPPMQSLTPKLWWAHYYDSTTLDHGRFLIKYFAKTLPYGCAFAIYIPSKKALTLTGSSSFSSFASLSILVLLSKSLTSVSKNFSWT